MIRPFSFIPLPHLDVKSVTVSVILSVFPHNLISPRRIDLRPHKDHRVERRNTVSLLLTRVTMTIFPLH